MPVLARRPDACMQMYLKKTTGLMLLIKNIYYSQLFRNAGFAVVEATLSKRLPFAFQKVTF